MFRSKMASMTSFFAVVCIMVAMVGCSGSPKSDGKVKLVFWSHQEDAFVDAYKKAIDAYQSAHSNVTIEYQNFPYDVYNQKLKVAFSSKKAPDMAEMFGTWVPEYSKNNLLAEVPDGDALKQAYYEAPLGGYLHNGKLYGLPLEYNIENGGMLVHPQMLKDKGITAPPATWAELVEDAKKLTVSDANGIQVKGFDFVSTDNITFTFLSLILQQNGSFWGDNDHVDFHSPEAVQAMTTLVDLVAKDKVSDLTTFGGELDTSDYFFKGNSAMTYRGPWTIAAGLDSYNVKDFEYVPVPSFTSGPPTFAAESGWGIVVSEKSKAKQEALDFLKFISEEANLRTYNLDTFTVPAKKAVAEDPEFVKQNPYMKTSLGVLQYGRWIGPVKDRDYFFKQINDHFQLMATGAETVNDGLRKIEAAINDSQDQHK